MDLGLVSIIMPNYNCGRFVGRTIESVLAQTYQNWELLFQDDCSTDNSFSVVMEYAKNDPRIKISANPKNSGAAITRNAAIRSAKGRWIAFLDSDDLWLPDKLEKQLKFMVDNGYAFTYHEYEEIDEQDRPLGVKVSGPKHIGSSGMLAYCWPGCLSVIYNRQVVGNIQIKPIAKNNDYAMWIEMIRKAPCYLLKENLAQYRKRSGSISNHSYMNLIKWHYRLWHSEAGYNPVTSWLLTGVNLVCGVYKKLHYVKRS